MNDNEPQSQEDIAKKEALKGLFLTIRGSTLLFYLNPEP